ncbi:MAG: Holliday junction resolvase RuvX, partial [Bacteroidia bacterium]|nr:Holliday junction resolvase RuvX [Bacteroidia bacterium]
MSRILALDYGLQRVGVAVTDPLRMFAQPLTTVDTRLILDYLKDYLSKESVDIIVLGLPTRFDGSDTHATSFVNIFAEKLRTTFPAVNLVMADERLTSRMAKA